MASLLADTHCWLSLSLITEKHGLLSEVLETSRRLWVVHFCDVLATDKQS